MDLFIINPYFNFYFQEARPLLRDSQQESKSQQNEVGTTQEVSSQSSTNAASLAVSANNNSNLAWEIFKLVQFGWYWGRMTRGEAERKLADQPDGYNSTQIQSHLNYSYNNVILYIDPK